MPRRGGAKTRRRRRALQDAVRFATRAGRVAGFVETDRTGALGALYGFGCDIAVAFAPSFRPPSGGPAIRKFTIGGRNGLRVDGLLAPLTHLEAAGADRRTAP